MKICSHCQTEAKDPNARFCGRDGKPLVEQPSAAEPANETSNGAPMSGSVAMALFPAHFIEQLTPDKGYTPPCQPDLKLNITQYDYDLPIITFWYLYQQNLIRFVQPNPARPYPSVGIEAIQATPVSIPGLEFDFLEIIKACLPGTPAQVIFKQSLGRERQYPEINLHTRMNEWLIQLGYGQADRPTKAFIHGIDQGFTTMDGRNFLPDCERIKAQQPAAQKIHHEWMKFLTAEPELYAALFEDVVRAGEDACNSGKYRWSSYCRAKKDYAERRQRQQLPR